MKHSNNARRAYSHHAFFSDARGAIVLIFALLLVPIVIICGMASDAVRINALKRHVQSGVDMAVLAGARHYDNPDPNLTLSQFQAIVEDAAEQSFDSNMGGRNGDITCSDPTVTANIVNETIMVEGECRVPAFLKGGLVGAAYHTVTATATAAGSMTSLDLALVVDLSHSMVHPDPTKIVSLRNAAETLVDTLITPVSGTRTRISLIPYSAGVNAGIYGNEVLNRSATDDAEGDGPLRVCVAERIGGEAATDEPPAALQYMEPLNPNPSILFWDCPTHKNPVLPLTSDERELILAIRRFDVPFSGSATTGHVGIAWGWYTLSPEWSGVWPAASDPLPMDVEEFRKVMVIMSDGSFGLTGTPGVVGSASEQALKLCQGARDAGIEIFTIGFDLAGITNSTLQQEAIDTLAGCADDADHVFLADNGVELLDAYETIASQFTGIAIIE